MPFQDRAKSLLELLRLKGIGTSKPVIFITHSLGGIVVKQMLRTASDGNDKRFRSFASKTRGVVFLSTPHTGSNLNSYLTNLAAILDIKETARPSDLLGQLKANAPELRDLNEWYRNHVRGLHVETRALYETEPTVLGRKVVDEGPSDPTIFGLTADPVDADHITIAKPVSRDAVVHLSVVEFVEKYLTPDEPWDVTLPGVVLKFNRAKDNESLDSFNKDYGGKRVKVSGFVMFIHLPQEDPNSTPGYSIASSLTSPSTDWVLASFDPDLFRRTVKKGEEIAISGRVGRENTSSGATLFECNWQDLEK